MQTPVAQLDPFEFAALQPAGQAFQPPVEFGATSGQPFVGGCRQAQLGRNCRHGRHRQQMAVEAAVVGRSLDPDAAGAQPVPQRGENGRLRDGMGDILGYARVSTGDQDAAGQTLRLTEAGAIKVFSDIRSGNVDRDHRLAARVGARTIRCGLPRQ